MKKIKRKSRNKKPKKIILSSSLIIFLSVAYAAFNTNISLKAKGNIKEKSRIIQSWTKTDKTDFHSDYYK